MWLAHWGWTWSWFAESGAGLKCHRTGERSCAGKMLMLSWPLCTAHSFWEMMLDSKCFHGYPLSGLHLSNVLLWQTFRMHSQCVFWDHIYVYFSILALIHMSVRPFAALPACSCWMPAGGGKSCWAPEGWWGSGRYSCPCRLHGYEWQWQRSTLETGVRG